MLHVSESVLNVYGCDNVGYCVMHVRLSVIGDPPYYCEWPLLII